MNSPIKIIMVLMVPHSIWPSSCSIFETWAETTAGLVGPIKCNLKHQNRLQTAGGNILTKQRPNLLNKFRF